MIGRRFAVVAIGLFVPAMAQAQSWSWDARTIGMGGSNDNTNLTTKMMDDQKGYTSIVLPLGLIQVFNNTDRFDPSSKQFDPIMAVELGASPWHYVIGRDSSSNPGEVKFVNDIRNGTVSRDLTTYKGFVPANDLQAEGLFEPSFGHTFKVYKNGPNFQGFYVGAGPYFGMHSQSTISPALTTVLSTGVNQSNATFPITETDQEELAAAVTGGYRARFALPGSADQNGLYVAANYNYLRGFGYNHDNLGINLLTDGSGQLTSVSNVAIGNTHATHGTGWAIDLGAGAQVGPWEFGFGAKGIGNRIDWTNVKQRTFTLASVTAGSSVFVESPTTTASDARIELPVDYRSNVRYNADHWSAVGDIGHGFGGNSFHAGLEWRPIPLVSLRGGSRYTFQNWNPTVGAGINLGKIGFDVAAFGTNANIEQKRDMAIAASIRINHSKKEGKKKS
jgi:hypothetical protein